MPAIVGMVHELVLLQKAKDIRQVLRPELLAVLERKLEGGALDVLNEDREVVRIDQAILRRT